LENFLPSVMASAYANLRIIVADNGSTDDSVPFLHEHFSSVEVHAYNTNEGFAGGYNRALKKIESEYYILLNSDVSVTPGWIEPVIELLQQNELVGACQPKLLSFHNPQEFEYAGAAGGWIDALGYPFSRGRIFDVCEKDEHQYDEAQPVFWASGAAMFIRARLFHELNGFDVSFFAHQEEIDLCWRMQLAGFRIMACPASVVYHVGAGTLPRGGRKVFLNFRNNLRMISKNMPLREKIWKLPLRIILDMISAWKGLLTGDAAFFAAIFRAHIAFLKEFVAMRKKAPYPLKPLPQLEGVYKGSVVWQYFVKHHTRFREIIEDRSR